MTRPTNAPLAGLTVLDLTHIAMGDIHPNNAGYAQIASVFREAYLDR